MKNACKTSPKLNSGGKIDHFQPIPLARRFLSGYKNENSNVNL